MDFKSKEIIFKPRTKDNTRITSHVENNKIGVLDLEVFNEDEPKVYAGGIYTYMSEQDSPLLFYIDETTKDSYNLVLEIINEMLRPKYKGLIFYWHNFGKYDFNFILPVLLDYNAKHGKEIFKLDPIFKDNRVLQLTIRKIKSNNDKTYNSVTIRDSYAILNKSLAVLGKELNVEVHKGSFPHDFATLNTLFYKGNTPDYKYYDFDDIDMDEKLFKKNFYSLHCDFKEEACKYLKDDLVSLFQVIIKANKIMFLNFRINITDSLTISGLASKIFRRYH